MTINDAHVASDGTGSGTGPGTGVRRVVWFGFRLCIMLQYNYVRTDYGRSDV